LKLSDSQKNTLFVALLAVFLFLNLIAYVNDLPLFGEEHRRCIVAQEMILTGNYITPTLFQTPYYNKPPMQNWMIAASSLLLNNGEVTRFNARLVTLLCFLIIGFAMYYLLRRNNPTLALVSFLIVCTNYLMLCEYANDAEPDIIITMFTFLSYFFYIKAPTRFIYILISAVFMAAGVLTKGMSVLFFYPAIILYTFRYARNKGKRFGFLGLHLLISLALPAIWVLLFYYHGDAGHLMMKFSREISARAEKGLFDYAAHILYYPVRVFAVLMPWTFALIFSFKRNNNKDEIYLTSQLIFLVSFTIFTIIPGSGDRYLMPAYPFFAIAAAYHFDVKKMISRKSQALTISLCIAGALGLIGFFITTGYIAQIIIFAIIALICARLYKYRFTIIQFTAIFAFIFFMFYEHGLYYHRTNFRHDYLPNAMKIADRIDNDLPVVIDRDVNLRTGLYIERQLKRPIFRDGLRQFDRYYYISYPDKTDSTAIELLRVPRIGKPEQAIVLQFVE